MSAPWLVPRPAEEEARVREAFAARGASALVFPVLEIVPLFPGVIDAAPLQAVLLTSRNGARALARLDLPRALPVLAVGDATAAIAREAGFVSVGSAAGDAEALVALAVATLAPENGALLHLSGAELGQDPAPPLREAGFTVERRIAYTAKPVEALPPAVAEALRSDTPPAGVAFFSPRTVEVFDTVLRRAGLADTRSRLVALCLSRAVADRLESGAWAAVRIAARPALDGLLELVPPGDVRAGNRDGPGSIMNATDPKPGDPIPGDGQATGPGEPPAAADAPVGEAAAPEPPAVEPAAHEPAAATPTERIIEQFGGIRPMAAKLTIPVTTVQGWKRRNAIPEQRHGDILAAARQWGIAVDPVELARTTPANPGAPTEEEPVPETAPSRIADLPVAALPPPRPPTTGGGSGWLAAWIAVAGAIVAVTAPLWAPGLYGARTPDQTPVVAALADRVTFLESRVADGTGVPIEAMNALTDRVTALETSVGTLQPNPDAANQAAAALDSARTELSGRIDALSGRIDEATKAAGALDSTRNDLSGRIDALSQRIDEVAKTAAGAAAPAAVPAPAPAPAVDLGPIEARLDAAEGQLEGVAALNTALETLSGRVDAIDRAVSEATGRIGALEARPQTDGTVNGLMLGLAVGQLREAVAAGGPLDEPLKAIEGVVGEDSALAEPLATLRDASAKGIPTLRALVADFHTAAAAAREAGRTPENGDWFDRALSSVESVVTVRPAPGEVLGDDAESVLARAEGRLQAGDLAGADAALDALTGPVADAMASWRAAAATRLSAERAAAALTSALAGRIGAAPAQ